ncbi:MAG: ABC transporter substrate-binding protein [Alphaproteobacteria bacterium]|nr:ABC transporter substrate-binding protein [Alphaproteobacteria bacterium]
MSFRWVAGRIALAMLLAAGAQSTQAADFVDSAQRRVMLPERIGRVMPAGPTAEVLVFALAPDKLIGWTRPLSAAQQRFLPAKAAHLPVIGRLSGPYPTAGLDALRRLRPDVIVDAGPISAERSGFADAIQRQSGIPYIFVDDSIERMPLILRSLGTVLGVGDRAEDLAIYAEHAIDALRGRLLIRPPNERPKVYYGRRPDGLETALPGSPANEEIDEGGVINVAAGLGRDGRIAITPAQLRAWDPNIIIAEDRPFYDSLLHDPIWRTLDAVRYKRVYLAPSLPFGWIDDPPGVNRLIGLYWLSTVFYPDMTQEDLRTQVKEFYDKFYGDKLTDAQVESLMRYAEAKAGETRRVGGEPLVGIGAALPTPVPGPGGVGTGPAPNTGLGGLGLGPPGRRVPTGGMVPLAPPTPLH